MMTIGARRPSRAEPTSGAENHPGIPAAITDTRSSTCPPPLLLRAAGDRVDDLDPVAQSRAAHAKIGVLGDVQERRRRRDCWESFTAARLGVSLSDDA
jgi:hypothetical protein